MLATIIILRAKLLSTKSKEYRQNIDFIVRKMLNGL
jgi:hypothetical protein